MAILDYKDSNEKYFGDLLEHVLYLSANDVFAITHHTCMCSVCFEQDHFSGVLGVPFGSMPPYLNTIFYFQQTFPICTFIIANTPIHTYAQTCPIFLKCAMVDIVDLLG